MNSQYDQLPDGLITQLVEYYSGIAVVIGLHFFQAVILQLLMLCV